VPTIFEEDDDTLDDEHVDAVADSEQDQSPSFLRDEDNRDNRILYT
jgi:hypothetical protein